jgi:hypothetical protein
MCLDNVTSLTFEEIEGEGWKFVRAFSDETYYPVIMWSNKDIPYNSWTACSEDESRRAFWGYPAGFHMFETKQDAMKYYSNHLSIYDHYKNFHLVKVKYRNILARGLQLGIPVIVTQWQNVAKPAVVKSVQHWINNINRECEDVPV